MISRAVSASGTQEIKVEATERGAAIARDEAGGEPSASVDRCLHEQKANNSLRSRDEDTVLGKVVFVGERQQRGRALGSFDVRHFAFAPRQEISAGPHWELTEEPSETAQLANPFGGFAAPASPGLNK